MKIGLVDVDGHNFPNLALMKISGYHKARGDEVEFVEPVFGDYELVYMSKVFTFTPDYNTPIKAAEVIKGGTGYDLKNKLPKEIENHYPDYTLYGLKNEAYGFLTRGCPNNCGFCIVTQKEGCKSVQVAELGYFWQGQKDIILSDPNITACKDKAKLFKELVETKSYVNFNQGLDARLLTDEDIYFINQMKIRMLHMAWDNYEMKTYEKLKRARAKLIFNRRKLSVYVLCNYNTSIEQDLERIYKLRELEYDPYVMIYEKETAPKEVRRMARWVNNKRIFRVCERFEDYI